MPPIGERAQFGIPFGFSNHLKPPNACDGITLFISQRSEDRERHDWKVEK